MHFTSKKTQNSRKITQNKLYCDAKGSKQTPAVTLRAICKNTTDLDHGLLNYICPK